jgi:phage terminase large subunit GpA-like protein
MLRDTPVLRNKVKQPRSKNSANTLLHKVFPGGHITMAGSNSPASLASRPVRIVLCDEVDRYPASAGTEGDPVNLARKRTATFWNRTIILTSTPTVKGVSRIEAEFDQSDQRYYFVPCPHCGEYQKLVWANVTWLKDEHGNGIPRTAGYTCEFCAAIWSEIQRHVAVKRGEWRATAVSRGRAGFHLSELYSPWSTLEGIVQAFLEAKGRPELLKTWVNTALGETWEDEGERIDGLGLYGRREKYPAQVPADAILLTAGVDIQRDRIELEVVGWGEGEESWCVDYLVLPGDTSRQEVWRDLDDCLGASYTHETGTQLHITSVLIDSSDQTTTVYQFVKPRQGRRIYAGKGVSGPGRPVVKISRKLRGKTARDVDLYQIGVDDAKGIIYARLAIEEPGPGYCHFSVERDEEYFSQLTAEKLMVKYYKGFPRKEWVKTRPRNEALDCRVYALAALKILNPVWSAISKRLGKEPVNKKAPDAEVISPLINKRNAAKQQRRPAKNWTTGWKR